MTVDDVIEGARTLFGEITSRTLSNDQFERFVHDAIRELYTWLSPDENSKSFDTEAVALTAGVGPIPDEWDKIIEVLDDGEILVQIDRTTLSNIDTHGAFFAPENPVWHFDGENIYVRPTSIASVDITHTILDNTVLEALSDTDVIEIIPTRYLSALTSLVASYAYSQEEDAEQAGYYRTVAQSQVQARLSSEE